MRAQGAEAAVTPEPIAMGERESSARCCPTHHRRLQEIAPSRKAPDGLWCPEGHAPRVWDSVDVRTGRVAARATRHGFVPMQVSRPTDVWVSGRAHICARCGVAWTRSCGCQVVENAVGNSSHGPDCTPPEQCPNGHRNWQRPRRG